MPDDPLLHDTLVVIPARHASTRLPGKPLRLLRGRPLVLHAWSAARDAGFAHVVVATDDERVARVVRDAGGEAEMTSADHPSGTDRVAEVARRRKADVVLNLQGDEPRPDAALLRALCAAVREGEELATAAAPLVSDALRADPSVVKVVCDVSGHALYFSRAAIPAAHPSSNATPPTYGHLGVYAFRRETLLRFVSLPPSRLEMLEGLEQLRALENGIRIRVLRAPVFTRGVDTEADLEAHEQSPK
jgi:3-deoxy-manno-octulosonate cytidylyltransferase (CMP-KDO synthetase)